MPRAKKMSKKVKEVETLNLTLNYIKERAIWNKYLGRWEIHFTQDEFKNVFNNKD